VKLLLVEDHQMNREMLSRRLKKLGYDVVTAVDGEQSIVTARCELPDVILMDMSLPLMDGWEATRQLKSNPATNHIPVIALTAYIHEFDRTRALEAGCSEYETKPVEMQSLIDKIERLGLSGAGSSSRP